LYHHGIDIVVRRFLTHEEVEQVLNDCHLGACGGHVSRMARAQNILCASYCLPSIFKDCIEVVKKLPPCHIFHKKECIHPSPLHPIVTVSPFAKWGIENPTSIEGHSYIIIFVDYFTKWVEVMPTFLNDGRTTEFFVFNHIITRFDVPKYIVTNHGSHF
jgi:hypothetical protein